MVYYGLHCIILSNKVICILKLCHYVIIGCIVNSKYFSFDINASALYIYLLSFETMILKIIFNLTTYLFSQIWVNCEFYAIETFNQQCVSLTTIKYLRALISFGHIYFNGNATRLSYSNTTKGLF